MSSEGPITDRERRYVLFRSEIGPSELNAIKYFVDTYRWAEEEGVEIFWFSSFDEAWKVDKEGDVGAYWGLWDKDGVPKYF